MRMDLLRSVKLDARRLVVKVRPVLDSTSILCSCNYSQRPMVVIPHVENVSEAVARIMKTHISTILWL